MTWWKDRSLQAALGVALALRTVPLALWASSWPCTRDECTYLKLAIRLAEGQGITDSSGWLWAPGYPALLGLHRALTGWASSIRATQVVVALGIVVLLYHLAGRAAALWTEDPALRRRASRIAAWLYAASLPQAFFAMSLWSEVLYSGLLLVGLLALHAAAPAHDPQVPPAARVDPAAFPTGRALRLALLLGAMIGACVLFRGVATYMLPIFVVALLWRRWRQGRAWAQAGAAVLAAVLVVAPYSAYISAKYDTFIVSDRTLGQMMWLGNNDFPPVAFDYGNGPLSRRAFDRAEELGRPSCAPRKEVILRDACEVQAGLDWIQAHPGDFLRRVPLRIAQLVTPHSLLTRHLRWGRWQGLPQWADELTVTIGAAGSLLVMWGGALGLAARGRRALGLVVGGILLYHVAAISLLAGLSRYRIPLEPLLMIYAAQVLAAPGPALEILRRRPWRALVAGLALALLVPLSLWFLPAGWPGWRTW